MPDDGPIEKISQAEEKAAGHGPPRIPDHELLRVIGRGGYGEVWLARNVMGTLRAVKIIYRSTFEHQRPYEREFEGIKRYEPVSRTHESQVAILHVGRHEKDEYYYYVMELADAVEEEGKRREGGEGQRSLTPSLPFSPANYAPHTLASDLKQRGKLPLDECITLGLSLAAALQHLHQHGLIHRDIKPSNIIFVNGVPKLADIGLVAQGDSTVSFVGTCGYFPPEGPGSAQTDLYSLGKVLYEISTGKDRNEFPDLPSDLEELIHEARLLEFNEILLKACHGDPRQRYTSARHLFDELSLLRAGKSVRQKRGRERLAAHVRRGLLAATVLLVAAVPGLIIHQTPPTLPQPRQLLIDDTVNLFFVDGARMSRQFDFSSDGQRLVIAGMKGLSIWSAGTGVNRLLDLPGFTASSPRLTNHWMVPHRAFAACRWAPDNQHFVFQGIKTIGGTPAEPVRIWALFLVNVETAEARQIGPERPEGEHFVDLCWGLDGQSLAGVDLQRRFHTLTLDGGSRPWRDASLLGTRPVTLGGFSPDGAWLAVSTDTGARDMSGDYDLWLVPRGGGPAVPFRQQPGFDAFPTWAPDGQSIYFVSSGGSDRSNTKSIWKLAVDLKTGLSSGEAIEIHRKEEQAISHPRFIANSERMIYVVDEPNTRVWIAPADGIDQASEVLRGQHAILSPDAATIYHVDEPKQRGVFAIDAQGRSLPRQVTDRVALGGLNLSPDGRQLAMLCRDRGKFRLAVVSTTDGSTRWVDEWREKPLIRPVWSPDGEWLAYARETTLYRVSRDGQRREALATLHYWCGWEVRWSPDGRHIAALAYETPEEWEEQNSVIVVSVAEKTWRKLTPATEDKYKEALEWHPDGQRLTYHYNGPERFRSQIRMAFLDGRATEILISLDDHWVDYGIWSPDGRQFVFEANACQGDSKRIHNYDAETRQITHGVRAGFLPQWSQTGAMQLWSQRGESLRHFEVIENFR